MTIRVYNTLAKQKEEFVPREPGKVSMYVCGVTPYNHPHIGNARPFITWDVIRRYLEYKGFQVKHIQNFTDIDDKIIKVAQNEGRQWYEIANRYIDAYFKDMDALKIKRAHMYPKVSEHIPEVIEMVQTLIDKGFAYAVEGDVYYSVNQFSEYGKLSGRELEDMKAGARVDIDDRKKHPMDFALWKSAKPGEPAWESPWGSGRPGWHIECSAMSLKYLGTGFDFHGGGSDLIFPHHENEIAQSEACIGETPFVRYWLHNGFITVNEEKMSKSLGNFFLVKDILVHFAPEVLRFFILSTHYRSPLDFNDEKMAEAGRALSRLQNTLDAIRSYIRKGLSDQKPGMVQDAVRIFEQAIDKGYEDFTLAMDDDFNTAQAIAVLFDLARETNGLLNQAGQLSEGELGYILHKVERAFVELGGVIGLFGDKANDDTNLELIENIMQIVIDIRQEARQKKDWATSDLIRNRLQQIGIILEDTPQGPRWKKR
jgi:cysteinyl-tRNA synthetase